ncbi:MAG: hypothetical protein RMY62_026645 [Nostoc sp. ZfuVER08]|jgi:hypothetical protein|uniref:Alpha-mannosidase n=1 Tax=Nostoc punctiforme FACHB-252 TaxID=1357509 RepID=A0ABR8HIS7_NOSPU|nr:hypothetical protein [Nostoc punctiforme]MBD2615256.1 hypothetical protein [Nostoc punctiforme FACHB-252]MBL1200315.1 hypothetical protein [Nostoc sp. GBBB01]MDZ8010025.1 hypothetical protein [Nostoc sp. ZfuVER08]
MKYCRPRLKFSRGWLLAIITALAATPAIAQTANFGTLTLSTNFDPAQGKVQGFTGGSYSLSAISNRDREQKACIGFADPNPDHIMVLENDFSQLTVEIDSNNNDTTLLIQGPDKATIRCGDDTGKSKDASISDRNWKKGTYRIWVGTFNPGMKRDYTVTVEQ